MFSCTSAITIDRLTPCSVMVIVEGATATLTNSHFSGGTLLQILSIALFNISIPTNRSMNLIFRTVFTAYH